MSKEKKNNFIQYDKLWHMRVLNALNYQKTSYNDILSF